MEFSPKKWFHENCIHRIVFYGYNFFFFLNYGIFWWLWSFRWNHQNSKFSRKLWWKNCWKLPKFLYCRRAHSSQIIKDIDPILIAKISIKIVSKISSPYILYFPRNKSVIVGSGWAGSSFQMIQLVQKWSYKCSISSFSDFF